jgi:hypothetical protein
VNSATFPGVLETCTDLSALQTASFSAAIDGVASINGHDERRDPTGAVLCL